MVRSPGLSVTCLCQEHVPLFQALCQMVVTDCWFFPVLTYMPQDFRSLLFKQQRERSEKRRQAEVDALVAAGGSIHDKYLLLWRQQMDRRHQLAQLGSSTGVLRTIVKWLVGVPQVLLDFVCRINDDNGYNSTFQSEKMMTSLMLVMLAVSICATSCFLNIIVMFFQC
jgi:hypothetical protein